MPLETTVVRAAPAGHQTPMLAIAVARGAAAGRRWRELDRAAGGALQRLAAAGDFAGKRDETALVYPTGPAGRIMLVGMGKPDEVEPSGDPARGLGRGEADARARRGARARSICRPSRAAASRRPKRGRRSPKGWRRAPGSSSR